MTGDELVEYIRTDLLLDTASPHLWSDDLLLRYLIEAENEFARKTYALLDADSSITQISLVAGTATYSLDDKILYVYSAYIDGQSYDLTSYTRRFIPNQLTTSIGIPRIFTMDEAAQLIRVYPIPDDTYTLKLRIARLPLDDLTTSSEPSIPPQYHIDLPEYVAYRCLKNSEVDGSNLGSADAYKKSWDGRLTAAKREYYRIRMGVNATAQNNWTGRRNGYGY